MSRLVWFASLVLCAAGVEAAPGSYSGAVDGADGAVPAAAIVTGLIGAAAFAASGVRREDRASEVIMAAWWGFVAGAIMGMPIACLGN